MLSALKYAAPPEFREMYKEGKDFMWCFSVAAYRNPINRTVQMQAMNHSRPTPQMSMVNPIQRYPYMNSSLPGVYIARESQPAVPSYTNRSGNRAYENGTNGAYGMVNRVPTMYPNRPPRSDRHDSRMGEQVREPRM